jgi:hypothetical protein
MSATVWSRVLQFFPTLLKGNSGAAPSINWNSGSVQSITLNAATVTPTFVSPVGGANLALVITQDGVGGRAVTWPAAVSWLGGTPPILLSGAGQTTLVYFYWDGTTYWGSLQSGASPASIIPWTAVAAGTALAASLAKPNLAADSSGAQSTITLPSAAQMASSDGYEFTIKATGAMVSPVIVAAGAGATIELLNAPGTFGASTWMPIQGQGVVFKYELATTTWKMRASSEGSGAPGTVAYNPQWYTLADTGIAWDPAAAAGGSDSNTGAAGSPLLTFAEVVRRFGSKDAILGYGKNCIINQGTLAAPSAQPVNQDEVYFEPVCSGTGQAILNVALGSAGADFAAGALSGGYGFAAATPTAGGVQMTMAAPPGYVVANVLLENTARTSYAFVDAITGGNAVLTQPQTKASLLNTATNAGPVLDNDWVAGDNIKAWLCQRTNLGRWSAKGSDRNGATKETGSWVFGARIADISGNATSGFIHLNQADRAVLSFCQIDSRCQVNALGGPVNSVHLWGCMAIGLVTIVGGNAPFIAGGANRGGTTVLANNTTFANTVSLHGATQVYAAFCGLNATGVFNDGSVTLLGGSFNVLGKHWGSYACTVDAGSTYLNGTGSTFVLQALLTNGALKLGTATTGSSYTGNGVMVDGVNLTPANIDAGGAGGVGLFNPKTGARFCNPI